MSAVPVSQPSLTDGFGMSELLRLIKQGSDTFQQEDEVKDAVLLALAHGQLLSDRVETAGVLNIFLQEFAKYQHTRRTFQEASIHFAKAYEEQQAWIVSFRKTLFALIEGLDRLQQVPTTPLDAYEEQQAWIVSFRKTLFVLIEGLNRLQQVPTTPLDAYNDTLIASLPSQRLPEYPTEPALKPDPEQNGSLPDLSITCFGRFEVRRSGQPVILCSNRNAQMILRYLVAQDAYSASADKLQIVTWPEDEPQVARNKLHIAISALRRSLHAGLSGVSGSGYLVCKNQVYSLNPAARIRTDAEEFLHYYHRGQQSSAERIACYEKACHLYKGPFLPEDLHDDWSFLQREQFNHVYLHMCRMLAAHYLDTHCYDQAAKWATMILSWDSCDEAAHVQLMQIYATQGYRSKALQQYHHCERILRQELGVQPLPTTIQFYQTLLEGHASS